MEEKTEIRAVELVRRIRDRQVKLLEGKSNEEIIEFFRDAGEAFRAGARAHSGGAAEAPPRTAKRKTRQR